MAWWAPPLAWSPAGVWGAWAPAQRASVGTVESGLCGQAAKIVQHGLPEGVAGCPGRGGQTEPQDPRGLSFLCPSASPHPSLLQFQLCPCGNLAVLTVPYVFPHSLAPTGIQAILVLEHCKVAINKISSLPVFSTISTGTCRDGWASTQEASGCPWQTETVWCCPPSPRWTLGKRTWRGPFSHGRAEVPAVGGQKGPGHSFAPHGGLEQAGEAHVAEKASRVLT